MYFVKITCKNCLFARVFTPNFLFYITPAKAPNTVFNVSGFIKIAYLLNLKKR